ncbi:reverse transcriptase domain-containing protein [Tanacetum coccineum]
MADQRTMAELLRAPTEGYAEEIVVPPILAEHFELRHSLINLVTLKQFFGFKKEDPHAHIRYFTKITYTLKYKDVPETSIKLMLFPFSIDGPAWFWLDKEPSRSILTWDDLFEETFSKAWDHLKDLIRACPHHGFTELHQLDTFYNGLNPSDQDSLNSAAGGNLLERSAQDVLKIIENKSKVRTSRNKLIVSQAKASNVDSSEIASAVASAVTSAMTAMFKQHQVTPASASVKAVEESCVTCGGAHSYRQCPTMDGNTFLGYQDNIQGYVSAAAVNYNQGNTGYHPQSVANEIRPPCFAQPNVKNNQTRYNQGYNQDRGNYHGNQNYQAWIQQTQVAPSNELSNYKKINEANMKAMQNQIYNVKKELRNEMQSSMSNQTNELKNMMASDLKAITTRSGVSYDGPPIPPPFSSPPKVVEREPELVECLALANLGASINLMPLCIWKNLSLPELTPTQMILELTDRSMTRPAGPAEDVFVKVGKFHFLANFVVVDYIVDPWVPLILGRPFLRTVHALIDVYSEELTLRVDDEAITFKVGQTSRYSYNNSESVNRIDVIGVSCKEYAQEVLGFSDISMSGNPIPSLDPILSTSFPSLTPFEGGDFILEEIEACLTNDSILPGIDDDDFDPEEDLLLFEKLLNDDLSSPLPPKELHFEEIKTIKSSIDDPPELELKDLPSHLEYAFLEGTDKLPVTISKELKDEEKVAILKILMVDDFQPVVHHQRRVNPKIHEVIKKEVIKLLDAGLIYPIYDSPWVSPVHCVPKKGGMTVVENEDNELIPTRLVTEWRVCIDYRKLNDATRKDHFPFPFMEQMLERLSGNEYYCFLDGFSGYFQIPIDPKDQDKTTFTCPYGTFAYRRMPFDLFFEDSFLSCLSHLDKMLKWCKDTNLVLNWEKCHFMVKEGIVLGHKISKSRIEVDKAKVDVIAKLLHPTTVKGVRSFLECIETFNILKKKLTEAPILVAPDWDLPFEIMYDASDYALYLVLSKTIVYTDHSDLKYLLAKQDVKPRLLWLILLLQEFVIIIRDKKGAENLAADHLSRLENPHQSDLEKKEITETFPLKTLGMVTFHGDDSTPWFADFANYHAGNFVIKGMSSQ